MMPEVGHAPATIETELCRQTVSCGHCQQEQIVHVLAGTGIWSRAHQSVECLRCGQHFEVMLPDAIIGGPFLPRDISHVSIRWDDVDVDLPLENY